MKVKFLLPAASELREAIEYYDRQRPGLGLEFREEVYATLDRIRQFPLSFRSLSLNTRRCQTRRFPYGIIYQVTQDEVIVVAVGHLHREPDYWKGRK